MWLTSAVTAFFMMMPSSGNSSIRLIMSRTSAEVLFVEFEIKFSKTSISSSNVTFLSWSRKGSVISDILLIASQGIDLFVRRCDGSDSSSISFARTSLFSAIIHLTELYNYSKYHGLSRLIYSGGTEINVYHHRNRRCRIHLRRGQ